MDRYIAAFAAAPDGDLMFCSGNGVAYQADMGRPIDYGQAYFDMYRGYAGSEIERRLNEARVGLVNRHAGADCPLIDIGIGSGAFIRARPRTFGCDVNPVATAWLESRGLHRDDLENFAAYSFWDVLEHVSTPAGYFDRMRNGAHVFISMPIFAHLEDVRGSKHYKPNEHFYYFTEAGFIAWMALHGFRHLESNVAETLAGRESIGSFAFRLERNG
jgi:hypothetical protein